MDEVFWNQRYASQEFAYGIEANSYLTSTLTSLPAGRILLPGDGEGRNAVFAARLNWDVLAVDLSEEGRNKAMRLASQYKVSLKYVVDRLENFEPEKGAFDVVGLIFVHLPPEFRGMVHQRCVDALRPGGLLVLEAFTPAQRNFASGGPKDAELLYSADIVRQDFSRLELVSLEEKTVILKEGPYHDGEAAVVRMLAKKPSA
ncbi:MAG: class I SAM-dependent methyltransferase [Bacteroidia bacterium]|nr:class I SAM-dependent methyltransferase [Bacteroidia bacterium]